MKWPPTGLLAAALITTAVAVTIAVAVTSGRPSPASAGPLPASTYTPGAFVADLARQAHVGTLKALVSAGTGDSTVTIVTGTDASGEPCWTVTVLGGRAGNHFRCGAAPSADGAISIFPDISGAPGSAMATSVSLIGLARHDVARVEATLLDGSNKNLTLANGTFSYAATDQAALPTVVRAYDEGGRLIGEQTLKVDDGPTP